MNQVEALDHAATSGDDVFHHEHAFAGGEREAATQHENVVFLFREDEADLRLTRDLLTDHETAHRGRQNCIKRDALCADFGDQQLGETLDGIHALADLGALKIVAAVQSRAEHEMPFEQSAGAAENIEDLLLIDFHSATVVSGGAKNKIKFACFADLLAYAPSVSSRCPPPLEDELGDVLEKALRRKNLTVDAVGARSGVPVPKICDAIDYRSDLSCDELRRISAVLELNEVGLCALGSGRYPKPELRALPFCVWPLRMPHGIGVANAYLVAEYGATHAILFDTGAGIEALEAVWPETIRRLDAVFLTHVEAEHAGGLCAVVARFEVTAAFTPLGSVAPCGRGIGDGECQRYGALEVTAFTTPGHAAAHNCYLVRAAAARTDAALLISGDLVFAGSVGGAYFSETQMQASLRRMLGAVPPCTVIAPGHGPMTTVENELRFNPFAV